jgi:hypothetical protein
MSFNNCRDTFVRTAECFQLKFSVDEDDLTILGNLASVSVEDFLDILTISISYDPLSCVIRNLKEQFLDSYLHILHLLQQSQVVLRPYLAYLPYITSEP